MRRLSRSGLAEHPTTATVVGFDKIARISLSEGLLKLMAASLVNLVKREQTIQDARYQPHYFAPAFGEDQVTLFKRVIDVAGFAGERA